jgi:hypothetical protein
MSVHYLLDIHGDKIYEVGDFDFVIIIESYLLLFSFYIYSCKTAIK